MTHPGLLSQCDWRFSEVERTHKQTRWLLLIGVVILTLIPAAMAISTLLHDFEAGLQTKLQEARRGVTQATQREFILGSFASELRSNTTLKRVVDSSSDDRSQWQSSITRTRLRLLDSLDTSETSLVGVQGLSIERLEPIVADEDAAFDTERLWMSTKISAVAQSFSLLSLLDEAVFPFPLQAHGCSFKKIANEQLLEMRCLLSLTAWQLPVLDYDVDIDNSETTRTFFNHTQRSFDATISNSSWQLLNRAESVSSNAPKAAVSLFAVGVKKPRPRSVSTGVITGPLGRLVIHGN